MNKSNINTNVQQLIESERMLNDLMGNIPGMVYRCNNDRSWTMIFLNENCKELTGYEVEDLLYNKKISYQDLIHPEDAGAVWKKVQDALSRKERFELTYRIKTNDQQEKWVWEKGKGIFDDSNNLLYVEGFIAEVTQQKELELKYRETIELAVDGILQGNHEGIITYANASMLQIVGLDLDEIAGKHISELFKKEELASSPLRFDLIRKGEMVKGIRNLLKSDGSMVSVEMHSKLMPDGTIQTILRDISQREKFEKSIVESEEKYRNLFDKSMDPTLLINDFKFIDCNKAAVDILKFKNKDEVFQAHPSRLSPEYQPDGKLSLEKANEMMNIALKKGYHRFEWNHITTAGEIFPVDVSLTRIPVEGKIMLYTVWRDISEQKKAEVRQQVLYNISTAALSLQNLKEVYATVKRELGRLINTTNIFIALYDEKTDLLTIPFMVDKKDRFQTLPKDSLSAYVVKTQKTLLATRQQLDDLAKKGAIKQIGSRAAQWLGVPLTHKGKAIGVIVVQDYENENAFQKSDMELLEFVSHQISISVERKRFEDELKLAFERASEADRLKSAFLATMSHELRTPLNAIIGFSDLINDEISNEDACSFADTINKSGNLLLELVEDMFDITLIETGEVKIHKTEFSLKAVLEDLEKILKTEQKRMIDSKTEIKLIIPEEFVGLKIYTDRQKLNQILMNLLKNALKFTPTGTIEFGFVQQEKNGKQLLEFYVKDSGIGIPQKMHNIIFDMFRQVDESYTRAYGGAGIGLSLTKKLIEILGGNIWLKSEVDKGSTFYFTVVDYEPPASVTEQQNKTPEIIKIPDKTILVVEDDESSYELLKVFLKITEANILWSQNGIEAIELVKENPSIDLVLMDVNMPVMNGFEATRSIKKLRPTLPVIAQTAYAISGDKENAIESGCDDYLEKPIRKKKLYKLLFSFLGK